MKQPVKEQGRIVLYQLLNDRETSRTKSLGYELAILAENGKLQESWNYETVNCAGPWKGSKRLRLLKSVRVWVGASGGSRNKGSCALTIDPAIELEARAGNNSGHGSTFAPARRQTQSAYWNETASPQDPVTLKRKPCYTAEQSA
jgi:hypothetical protein